MWFGLLGPGRPDKGYRREHDTAPVCSDFTRDRPHSEIEIFCGTDWGTPMSHDVSAFGFSVYPVIEFDSVEVVGRVVNKLDRKSTRLNSSHVAISYAVFCLKKKK